MTILPVHDNSNDIIIYLDTRSGSSFDILESTAWIREVVVQSQKRRKGCHFDHHYHHHHRHLDYYQSSLFSNLPLFPGVGKFCSFSFSPLGIWKGVEEVHQVTVGNHHHHHQKDMWMTRMSKMLNVHLDQFYNK